MNKEASKLYDELFDNWINRFIPDKGDNRLEVESDLHKLIRAIKEDCAKDILMDLKTIIALSRTTKVDIYPEEIENIINKYQSNHR